VIEDPREQFKVIWETLRTVLEAADCTFDDVVEMTSYHAEDVEAHEYCPDGK
jgi:enamine deaminase RidA (YjgF/YER057c/UK114 family)